jgi:GT2 family glycosyltransferase
MKFALVLVSYNSVDETVQMIRSTYAISLSDSLDIVIVDNSESDSYSSKIMSDLSGMPENVDISMYRSPNNGYFAGLNYGLEKINPLAYDYIIIGNNDLVFPGHFFGNLQKAVLPDNTFAIAPDIISREGQHENPRYICKMSSARKIFYNIYYSNYIVARCLLFLANKLKFRRRGFANTKSSQCIHLSMGACYILLPLFFRHYSRLDDRVFLFGEEVLLSNQISSKDGCLYFVSGLVVHHDEHSSVSKLPRKSHYRIQQTSYKIYKEYL